MSSLKELILDGCHGLEDLPEFGECMNHLLRLSLKKTSIRELPSSIGHLVGLEELILTSCREFVCLPITIDELMSLRILKASECNKLYGLPNSLPHVPFLSSLDLSFCGLTESNFPSTGFDQYFPSLMELNLSGNDFVRVPISIHKLPKLQHLRLRKCPNLLSLPELPSSIRKLDAQNCSSLYASDSNPLKKAYGVFASPSQDHGLVLQMLITREEIPSWFVHQRKGNWVSAPLQHDFPQNERLGIALCFEISSIGESNGKSGCRLDVHNGKRLINKMICDIEFGYNLYILYLSNNYFSNEMQLDNQFELSISGPYNILNVWRSAARWMHKQDIEDFQKIKHMASVADEASSYSSSTSSPTSRSWTYHVFLSFRGEDTRNGFLGHLFAALERKGITVFKDDRVFQKGDVISHELLKAIDKSMFAITVLSPNYATSAWCLDELQRIVDRSKDEGLVIFPIFYDVEPSDVRYQNNSFKEAFEKHEGRFGQDSEKVRKWRDALTAVAGCSGWNSKDEHEAAQVESIAQDIHKKLIPKLLSYTEDFVGIQSQVEDLCSFLGMGLNDVRFISIWGMCGIGKTTLARTVYDAIQGDFKVSCFLANVREVCDKKKIVKIQQNLVSHVNISKNTFHNEHDGRKMIQSSLCNKKVLLVIDDVSETSQLKNLAAKHDWFGPGSRIIITTRNIHLLEIYQVYGSYEVKGLNQNEALQLFCMKAFKQDQPKEGYLDLSKEAVKYCAGLPLALEILGSYLCERTVDAWQSGLRKIRSDQHYEIFDKIKISYDDLDSMGRNIFLDIACFFKGDAKDYVIDILQKCGYNPQIEIDVLIQRSLVTLSEKGTLEMHDLVEELGKKIANQECPNDPGKRSRLWSKKDINFVLTKNKGTEAIQSIVNPYSLIRCGGVEAFSNMSQLKLLIIGGMEPPLGLNYPPLPSSLKVLHWDQCPLKALPLGDEQYELVEIVLDSGCFEQLWHRKKILKTLTNLELRNCWCLEQTPDLCGAPNLEKLSLPECHFLTEVHPSLIHHENLVLLDLSFCFGLKTFPGKLEMSSLKELILDDCGGLEYLPEFGECMKHLLRLSLERTSIRELPSSIGRLVGLEELLLGGCIKLYGLPYSLSHLPFLSSLDLSFCDLTERQFPFADFDHFPSLMELNLSGNLFISVPISIHKLPKLQYLWLDKCPNLQSLPELPSSVRELDARKCHSLYASEFNPLSNACRVFASPSQDHGVVFQMLITGKKIPSWFVHHQEGNCVSAPLQNDFPQNGRLGIALCFEISHKRQFGLCRFAWHLGVHNGKRLITKIFQIDSDCNLYIVYMSNDYLSNEMQLDNPFELSTSRLNNWIDKFHEFDEFEMRRSAARWIHKQDIEDFKKSETKEAEERAKKIVSVKSI